MTTFLKIGFEIWPLRLAVCREHEAKGQGRKKLDSWGHIHIFVFTDCKNNRFQKKSIMQNTNI